MQAQICFIIIAGSCLIPDDAICQDILQPLPYEKKLNIEAIKIGRKVKIDGNLNDTAWLQCNTVSNFIISYPIEGKKPVNETEVKIMYDDINLYIGGICHYNGSRKNLQVENMSRDFSYSNNELFNIMLGTFQGIKSPVLSLSVTPYNTQLDIMYFYDGSYSYNWDALWKSACRINDSTWVAEIAIPFSSLRYPTDSTVWAINFTRNNRSTGELSGWSLWPLAYSASRLDYGGLLKNIHPPKQNLNIRVQPYALYKSATSAKGKLQTGGDIKWAINTNTLLEGTLNTDFAQAEVDRQVINLTRSSVYFPERRQFFLENANLFSIGQAGLFEPFFSRRIGLTDEGAIVPIKAGLRLLSQSSKQSYGLLAMKQDGDSVNSPAWFSVLRYRQNIGKNLQAGAMEVLRVDEKGSSTATSLNPVSSVDLFWRLNSTMYLRGMASHSVNSGYNTHGWASLAEWNYSTNFITAGIIETFVSKKYNPKTGFLAREDFINTRPSLQMNIHKKWFPHSIAFFTPFVSADIYHEASAKRFQEANLVFSPLSLLFLNYSQINFNINSSWQHLSENFQPVGGINILQGNYQFTNYELNGQTNQATHYGVGAKVSVGKYYNGNLNSYSISLRIAPVPQIVIRINYTRNDFSNIGENKSKKSTYLITPQMLLAINANMQLSGIYQYNSETKSGKINFRFSWQYKPLSYLYLVYNGISGNDNNNSGKQYQQNAIFKISYVWQL